MAAAREQDSAAISMAGTAVSSPAARFSGSWPACAWGVAPMAARAWPNGVAMESSCPNVSETQPMRVGDQRSPSR